MKLLTVILSLFISISAYSIEPIRIEIGTNYRKYSNEDLRRRVWMLEQAVAQLQEQVYRLSAKEDSGGYEKYPSHPSYPSPTPYPTATPTPKTWTCRITSFGKLFVSTNESRGAALADVLQKCAESSSASLCNESSVKCEQ